MNIGFVQEDLTPACGRHQQAQQTKREQAKMWEDRAVAERAVFKERVGGEERRQRQIVMEVAAVEDGIKNGMLDVLEVPLDT